MGIATSAGVIRDFAGPYFVSVNAKFLFFILYTAFILSVFISPEQKAQSRFVRYLKGHAFKGEII